MVQSIPADVDNSCEGNFCLSSCGRDSGDAMDTYQQNRLAVIHLNLFAGDLQPVNLSIMGEFKDELIDNRVDA